MKIPPPRLRLATTGFTLIELMVGLGIVMILLGVGTHAGRFWQDEQELHKPMDKLKEYAKRACHLAIAEQRDWEVIISPHSLELRPKQAASEADEKEKRKPGGESVSFESDVLLAVRRFGEEKWQTPRPDHWIFQHSGICEPIHFRVERGPRALEVGFDPLTAGATEETEAE
jgi:Tfp pilus assembly protein FimT